MTSRIHGNGMKKMGMISLSASGHHSPRICFPHLSGLRAGPPPQTNTTLDDMDEKKKRHQFEEAFVVFFTGFGFCLSLFFFLYLFCEMGGFILGWVCGQNVWDSLCFLLMLLFNVARKSLVLKR